MTDLPQEDVDATRGSARSEVDDLLGEQEGKGDGEDAGERGDALPEPGDRE